MATIEPSGAAPPALPASEQEFLSSYFSQRYRHRTSYVQNLALTHGENILPLLKELLATQPVIKSIPIARPATKETELNADGGNPSPVVDDHPLSFAQTNATSRYIQRDTGLAMAITLAQKGSTRAVGLLLANLNHPYQVGKKSLLSCLALCATDDDILAAAADSAPAVRDALIAALTKAKRKGLVSDILGKPRHIAKSKPLVPLTTRFRRALERAQEYERERIWNKYGGVLDITNQPGNNDCEPGESIKDVVLSLQETFPPLHSWDSAKPDRRSPKLAAMIESSLIPLLKHDTKRTVHILHRTSWQVRGDNQYSAHVPAGMINGKRARRFWCHRSSNDTLFQEFWLSLIAVGNGELVKNGTLSQEFFEFCRGPEVDCIVRAVLVLTEADEFKARSTTDSASQASRLNNIFKFAAAGVHNLLTRISGCSVLDKRTATTAMFHQYLRELLSLLCSKAVAAIHGQKIGNAAFRDRLYNDVLKLVLTNDPSSWVRVTSPELRSFPPLAQHLFDQVQDVFRGTWTEYQHTTVCFVEDFIELLAPKDTSVYAIPNDGFVQPFSSVPSWDNISVFQTFIADGFSKTGKEMIQLDSRWNCHLATLAPNLTPEQRDQVFRWVTALPSFKAQIEEDPGSHNMHLMIQALGTNIELRHQVVFPLVFFDRKDKEVDLGEQISDWAAYVDIRIPDVRALLVKETTKPTFEDRLKWIAAILKATQLVGDVKEWIITLKWLIPKIRNEIHPNVTSLAPHLWTNRGLISRQYLDNATLEEAKELSKLYLAMDAQNTAAVTAVYAITGFIDGISTEALKRFAGHASHPFFQFAAEIRWRRVLTKYGELTALDNYNLPTGAPMYGDARSERDEESEIIRRQLLAKEQETLKTEGGPWGLYQIMEGHEEAFVQAKLNAFHSRWLSVKTMMDPDVQGRDVQAFKEARKSIWLALCTSLSAELGWRWKNSPTLVAYLNEILDVLASAPTKTFGADTVFDWNDDKVLRESVSYVQKLFDIYTDDEWIRANRDALPWYRRFRDLRLESTMFKVGVQKREADCVLKSGKRDNVRYEALMEELLKKSPSAIHLPSVRQFVSDKRPDLLTDEQIRMTKGIVGLFNQVETAEPWDFFVNTPSRLDPHQCELLKARHLLGMTDTGTSFNIRVQHAQSFIAIPTTTVEDVAKALCTPSLPSRIVEALLMFLPTIGEPASTLQILLAPVYIQSHLARTSIHAVENALTSVPVHRIPDFILPLFPPAEQRQQKVTVQKEGVRLACASMRLLVEPKITALIDDLLSRTDIQSDVHIVILQSLFGLLCGPEGRETRYQDITERIWKILVDTAHSDLLKKSGVAFVLLAVIPSSRRLGQAPRMNPSSGSRILKINTALQNLAKVVIPESLVDRYVDDILAPMCAKPTGENAGDDDLVDVRTLALQIHTQVEGWITVRNASKLAKTWRKEASEVPLEEDKDQLWPLFSYGISMCVGKEVQGALEAGQEGNTSWQELIGLIQDQVDHFLDPTLRRELRKKALERINGLQLKDSFLLQNFEKAKKIGAFTGDVLDLSRPLLGKGMEAVAWKIALAREITVFGPQADMTQDQINEEALRILLRIVDYTNRYLSDENVVKEWVKQLLSKASNNTPLKRFIGLALIRPLEDLIDWVHLDDVTLNVVCSNAGVFTLAEIGVLVERLASRENPHFYWRQRKMISQAITREVQRRFAESRRELTQKLLSSVKLILSPLIKRAQAAGWIQGPDATIISDMMRSHMSIMCTAFPRVTGPWLHHNVANALESGDDNCGLADIVNAFVSFGSQATSMGHQDTAIQKIKATDRYGIAPATALILEALMNGTVAGLDFTLFMAPHSVPFEVMQGYWFPFKASPDSEITVRSASQKNTSPMLLQMYRNYAALTINKHPQAVLMRPYVYLEYARLALTQPGTTVTPNMIAGQMLAAFTPVKDPIADQFTFAWAPPLGLALDMAEYLLHDVRDEAATEGEREARLIEQTVATFLNGWLQQIVLREVGKLLAEEADVAALEARYIALVEELCEDGSGGQGLALELGDFLPGGQKKSAFDNSTMEENDGDYC
ncbi:hypothetical protein BGZ54_005908 [Gamsiella multidivaricata]|nr:hypothetical protein BGZ54_005908 [Gamsiella multidivaricata]